MRVLVTASRKLTDHKVIWDALDELYQDWLITRAEGESFVVVHGAAKGGDLLADAWARSGRPHVDVDPVEANWELLGAFAGPERNGRMVAKGADVCLAAPRGKSTGTRDCMKQAKAAGIPVKKL